MQRIYLFVLALLCALVAAAPALASPHLSKAQNREISTLVARWVNDMVLRKDLADGWTIAGPDMRGTLSRKVWVSGRQVPVQNIDVLNDPRKAWYAKWKTRTEIGLVLSLKTGHGKNAEMYQAETVLMKVHGRWVVDTFYVDGIFRLGKGHSGSCVSSKCKVTGIADYSAGGGGGGGAPAQPRISQHWGAVVLLGIAGLPVLALIGMGLYVHVRNRRARATYVASR